MEQEFSKWIFHVLEHWHGAQKKSIAFFLTGAHTAQQEFVFDYAGDDDPRTDLERVQDERHLMRYTFSHHLLDLLPKPDVPIVRSSEIAKQEAGVPFTMLGIPRAYHRLTVINGKRRIIVDMEDQDGLFQVICAGGEDSENMRLVRRREPLLIDGRIGKQDSDIVYALKTHLVHIEK